MASWAHKSKEDLIKEIQLLKKRLENGNHNHSSLSESPTKQNLINTLNSLKLFGLIMSLDGTIAYANDYTHKFLGYSPNELNGKDFFTTLLPEGEKEQRRESFAKAVAHGGLFEERERLYHPNRSN